MKLFMQDTLMIRQVMRGISFITADSLILGKSLNQSIKPVVKIHSITQVLLGLYREGMSVTWLFRHPTFVKRCLGEEDCSNSITISDINLIHAFSSSSLWRCLFWTVLPIQHCSWSQENTHSLYRAIWANIMLAEWNQDDYYIFVIIILLFGGYYSYNFDSYFIIIIITRNFARWFSCP